jgi:hypothetical protein
MRAARCKTCGALRMRARPPKPITIRYIINGAKFKRQFQTVAERDGFVFVLEANGIEIIKRKETTK